MPECVFTFDALHTNQKTMERVVVEKNGDFLVQVKGNTPQLREAMEYTLRKKHKLIRTYTTIDKGHGRIETRKLEILPTTPEETGWPHTHTICRIYRERETIRAGETVDLSSETSLYVGSFSSHRVSPETASQLIREHWTIENCLHHRKDRSMNEDRCRAAEKGIGRVMCCIRSVAALLLGQAKESLKVIQRRLSSKPHLLTKLLSCDSPEEWLIRCKPYKLR